MKYERLDSYGHVEKHFQGIVIIVNNNMKYTDRNTRHAIQNKNPCTITLL